MNYHYIAYTQDKRLVKGKLSAASEEEAADLLSYADYQVVNLKLVTPFLNKGKLSGRFSQVKPKEIIMLSRQLALLLESGIDIAPALKLLQGQVTGRTLKRVIGEVSSDLRGGTSLSAALSKHPRVFSQMYHRAIAAGEQRGNLEEVLRRMADYMERTSETVKKVKGALTYPFFLAIVAIVVVVAMVMFVLPTFTTLYSSMGAELPVITKALLNGAEWFKHYGFYLILVIVAAAGSALVYIKTPAGKSYWDGLSLRLPIVGRISLLNELSRCCRTMALLFNAGLPLPEVMTLAIQSSDNKAMVKELTEVQQELIRGEGLSRPMARRTLFLPLMVQMAAVGEETDNLGKTLTTVAESYELEADERTSSAVALIQPIITIIIGLVIGLIAVAMLSAMYSIYSQISL